jgi:hypothetical protein
MVFSVGFGLAFRGDYRRYSSHFDKVIKMRAEIEGNHYYLKLRTGGGGASIAPRS